MKPTEDQKTKFRAKHAAVLTELEAAFFAELQPLFDFQPTEPFPAHCLSPIDEAVLAAQAMPADSDFRSMREWQIDRQIRCEM